MNGKFNFSFGLYIHVLETFIGKDTQNFKFSKFRSSSLFNSQEKEETILFVTIVCLYHLLLQHAASRNTIVNVNVSLQKSFAVEFSMYSLCVVYTSFLVDFLCYMTTKSQRRRQRVNNFILFVFFPRNGICSR